VCMHTPAGAGGAQSLIIEACVFMCVCTHQPELEVLMSLSLRHVC